MFGLSAVFNPQYLLIYPDKKVNLAIHGSDDDK